MITSLWLRRPFLEQFTAMISGATKLGYPVVLALLDIDNFKAINNTYGHLAGDDVLAKLGKLLQQRFSLEDVRGRWGGDEFIVAFHGKSKEDVCAVLKSFAEEFKAINFKGENGKEFQASLSIGLACVPKDGTLPYEVIKVADRRLYLATKNSGQIVAS